MHLPVEIPDVRTDNRSLGVRMTTVCCQHMYLQRHLNPFGLDLYIREIAAGWTMPSMAHSY